jgi:hypothetical protein
VRVLATYVGNVCVAVREEEGCMATGMEGYWFIVGFVKGEVEECRIEGSSAVIVRMILPM